MEQQTDTTPKAMPAITIGRLADDPTALGVIRPADDSWQLVIDKDGFPVFYIRCKLEEGDVAATGMLCVDDLLPPEMGSLADVMRSTFGRDCTREESDAEFAKFQERIAATGRPCPR